MVYVVLFRESPLATFTFSHSEHHVCVQEEPDAALSKWFGEADWLELETNQCLQTR